MLKKEGTTPGSVPSSRSTPKGRKKGVYSWTPSSTKFHENTLALGAFLMNLSSKAVVTSKYSLSVSCVNRVSNHNGMSHSMNMYRTTWVKWTEHQRSSEPTWGAPPPSCVASCPSAPPAARAPPRCPSVRTDLTSGPSLTRLQLSSTPSDQTISSFWSSIAD